MESPESVPPESPTGRPRSPRESGPNFWLSIFTALTGLMILADMMLGLRLPGSLVYWLNPVSWLGNWSGLTALVGGVLRGMDEGATAIGSVVGMPVIGSFVLWFVYGFFRWRWPMVVFILLTLPFLCAMQFTTKRAYEALARRYHTEGSVELEARAISKALLIIRSSSVVDPEASQLAARLVEIEGSSKASEK